jgi:hypothetical protein
MSHLLELSEDEIGEAELFAKNCAARLNRRFVTGRRGNGARIRHRGSVDDPHHKSNRRQLEDSRD